MSADTSWQVEADRMVARLEGVPPSVGEVMRRVPRHRFVPASLRDEAYDDTPLPLGRGGSTISAPHMVALQLEWAELGPGLRVLEIGSGSGYLAALVAELVQLGGTVDGVELDDRLARDSQTLLDQMGYTGRVSIHPADGRDGWPPGMPFDRVIVSCATRRILPAWIEQLRPGGTVIAPVGGPFSQVLERLRTTAGPPQIERGPECRFVALRTRGRPHI